MILLSQPPECWDYRYAPPCLTLFFIILYLSFGGCLDLSASVVAPWSPMQEIKRYNSLSTLKYDQTFSHIN
jgi:hypothetical protein